MEEDFAVDDRVVEGVPLGRGIDVATGVAGCEDLADAMDLGLLLGDGDEVVVGELGGIEAELHLVGGDEIILVLEGDGDPGREVGVIGEELGEFKGGEAAFAGDEGAVVLLRGAGPDFDQRIGDRQEVVEVRGGFESLVDCGFAAGLQAGEGGKPLLTGLFFLEVLEVVLEVEPVHPVLFRATLEVVLDWGCSVGCRLRRGCGEDAACEGEG